VSQYLQSESSLKSELFWIDSHAHLDFDRFDHDRHDVIERALARGVKRIISIGTRIESTRNALELARQNPGVIYASAGFHPLYMTDDHPEGWSALEELMQAPEVVGIGETGLDYYYDTTPHQQQRDSLRRHLQLSRRFNKPIIIHIRDAFDDAWRIISEEGTPAGGVVHCFTGGPQECERALELGLYISLSGIATF
jgi:TatD DNase family protein